jgi:hypothetical protein
MLLQRLIDNGFWSSLLQAVFSFLFGDDQFMRLYHKEANEDPDAEVTCWTAAGERTVCFSAPLNAPALVRKFIGNSPL